MAYCACVARRRTPGRGPVVTPEQFARVESLFEEACAQPDEGRAAWLRDRCADDPEVLRKVERMLVQDAAPTGVFDASSIRTNVHVAAEHWSEQRLREEFDAGGQYRSVVARRGRIRQRLPCRTAQSGPSCGRAQDHQARHGHEADPCQFEAGGRRCDHEPPGIARLLDAGVTLSGRPYFVMGSSRARRSRRTARITA